MKLKNSKKPDQLEWQCYGPAQDIYRNDACVQQIKEHTKEYFNHKIGYMTSAECTCTFDQLYGTP